MEPLVKADTADIDLFRRVANTAQQFAGALGGLQNNPSVHGLTPQEAATLAAVLRTAPAQPSGERSVTLSAKEVTAILHLVDGASVAAVMLPAHSEKYVSVTGLVTALLNAGNLLETAAKNAQPPTPKEPT